MNSKIKFKNYEDRKGSSSLNCIYNIKKSLKSHKN